VLWGGRPATLAGASLTQNILFAGKIYAASLGHWLLPVGLALDHAWSLWIGPGEATAIVGSLGLVLAATAVIMRRWPTAGWAVVWFWVAIFPAGALAFVSRVTLYQDHRAYLAGVGLAWIAGLSLGGALRWARCRRATQVAAVMGVSLAVGFVVRADMALTAVWADPDVLWDDVLEKYPTSIMASNGKGKLAFVAGRTDEAQRWFERAIRLSPQSSEGHKNLGITFARRGQWEAAIGSLNAALAIRPRDVDARLNLGKIYEHLSRPEDALNAYENVLRMDPEDQAVLARTAKLLAARGRYAESAARYERVVADGRADAATVLQYGEVLLRLERWGEAEILLASLVGQSPTSYRALVNWGMALEGRGAWPQALEAYRRAALSRTEDPEPYVLIGRLYGNLGRWEEAASAYQEALARDPRHGPAHFSLGLLAQRRGDTTGAISHYETMLRTPEADMADKTLAARARAAISELRRKQKL
jgi:tetratricopeptide (TPR) repeat protein